MPTFVSAPLPDLAMEESSRIVVDAGDPGAVITSMVIHFMQNVPIEALTIPLLPPTLVHEPREAPGLTR